MQTLSTHLQTLTSNPTSQTHAQLAGLFDTKVWGKLGKLDASTRVACNDQEPSCCRTSASWTGT